ncbi:RNA polymerase sigma factor [Celeribacter sp. ULVN23_4]
MMHEPPKLQFATYWENRPILLNYAFRILGSREAAEDVVQEAYIRFSTQDRATEPTHLKAYLFRIVHNLALNSSKRRRYERDQLRRDVPDWGLPAAALTPEDVLLFAEKVRGAMQIVEDLPKEQRQALELHRYSGHSMKEVARRLGVSERKAYRLAQAALATVALQLRGQTQEDPPPE